MIESGNGAAAIALRLFPAARPRSDQNVLNRFIERLSRLNILYRDAIGEEKARKTYEELKEYVNSNKEMVPKNKRAPTIIFAESKEEAFDEYIKIRKKSGERFDLDDLTFEYKNDPFEGVYIPAAHTVIVNLEIIRGHRGGESQKAIDAMNKLVSLHEFFHSFGMFGNNLRYRDRLYPEGKDLDDACAHYFALATMKKIYLKEYRDLPVGTFDEYYSTQIEALKELMKLLGQDTVVNAFFSSNFNIIVKKVQDLGVYSEFEAIMWKMGVRYKSRKTNQQDEETDGVSPSAIRAVRSMLPQEHADLASRMVLAANMHYHWNENRAPSVTEIASLVRDATERNANIYAYAFGDMLAGATQNLQTNFFSATIAPNAQIGISNAAGLWQALDMHSGTGIDSSTGSLLESAVTAYMLQNNGQFPTHQQTAQNIYSGYAMSLEANGIAPDSAMVTTSIMGNMMEAMQDRRMPEDSWTMNVALSFASENTLGNDVAELLLKPYDASTNTALASEINSIKEFNGYGSMLAEKAAQIFSDAALQPACGDIYGLIVTTGKTLAENPEINFGILNAELPGYSGFVVGTANLLNDVASQYAANASIGASSSDRLSVLETQSAISGANQTTSAAKEIFATLLEVRYPSDAAIVNGAEIVVVTPGGKIRSSQASAHALGSNIMGATMAIGDPRKMKHHALTAKIAVNSGLFGRFSALEYSLAVPSISKDPFESTPQIEEFGKYIQGATSDSLARIEKMQSLLHNGGDLCISGSMFFSDRLDGSKTPADVLLTHSANCLELSALFVLVGECAFRDDRTAKFIALDVINTEHRVEIGHICVGVLIESDKIIGHPKFNSDWEFRKQLLGKLGVTDSRNLKLLVIDPVNSIFDYRFENIRYLDKKQLLSTFHSNSGYYLSMAGKKHEAESNFKTAKELWGKNPAIVCLTARELIKKQKLNEAAKVVALLDSDYKTSNIYSSLGTGFLEKKDYHTAEKYFKEALRLNASNDLALYGLSNIIITAEDTSRYPIAKKYLETLIRVLKYKRKSAAQQRFVGSEKNKHGDIKIQDDEVGTARDNLGVAYADLARIYFDEKDYAAASATAKAGLAINTDNRQLRIIQGITLALQHTPVSDGIVLDVPLKAPKSSLLNVRTNLSPDKLSGSQKRITPYMVQSAVKERIGYTRIDKAIDASDLSGDEKRVLKSLRLLNHFGFTQYNLHCAVYELSMKDTSKEVDYLHAHKRAGELAALLEDDPLRFDRNLLSFLARVSLQNKVSDQELRDAALSAMKGQGMIPSEDVINVYVAALREYSDNVIIPFGKMTSVDLSNHLF